MLPVLHSVGWELIIEDFFPDEALPIGEVLLELLYVWVLGLRMTS
jgi:hypothetical protein